jgi:hypothetical protein
MIVSTMAHSSEMLVLIDIDISGVLEEKLGEIIPSQNYCKSKFNFLDQEAFKNAKRSKKIEHIIGS